MTVHFLIVNNERTGSTFLQTSLNQLPGVFTDYEILWPRSSGTGNPDKPIASHRHFGINIFNCRTFLEEMNAEAGSVGTRMTLHSSRTNQAHMHVGELEGYIPPEIRVIHLTRNYFDVLKSQKLRLGANILSEHAVASLNGDEKQADTENVRQLVRDSDTYKESEYFYFKDLQMEPLMEALTAMISNDLAFIQLTRRADHGMTIDYQEIKDRLSGVADFIGAEATPETVQQIVDKPVTRKLGRLADELMPDYEKLKYFCEMSNRGVRKIIDQQIPLSEVIKDGEIVLP